MAPETLSRIFFLCREVKLHAAFPERELVVEPEPEEEEEDKAAAERALRARFTHSRPAGPERALKSLGVSPAQRDEAAALCAALLASTGC